MEDRRAGHPDEPIIHTTEELARYMESGAHNGKPTIAPKPPFRTPAQVMEQAECEKHERELREFRKRIENLVGEITDELQVTLDNGYLTWNWDDEFRFQLNYNFDFQNLIDGEWISYAGMKYSKPIVQPDDLLPAFQYFKNYAKRKDEELSSEEVTDAPRRSFWDWLFGRNADER